MLPLRKPPSAAIQRLIAELGLRYRPSAQADLEAHAASLAFLAQDLADVPPAYLDRAIRKWTLESKFMPKAAELAAIAQSLLDGDKPRDGIDWIARGNAHLRDIGRTDAHWVRDANGSLGIETFSLPGPRWPKIDRKFTLADIEGIATGRRTQAECLAAKSEAASPENHYTSEA